MRDFGRQTDGQVQIGAALFEHDDAELIDGSHGGFRKGFADPAQPAAIGGSADVAAEKQQRDDETHGEQGGRHLEHPARDHRDAQHRRRKTP
jgi:hypothetical protein